MKALMGETVKKVRQDPQGREAMREFVIESHKDSVTIKLRNGKTYTVSRNNPKTKDAAA